MSNSLDAAHGLPLTPQSSRKRKIATDTTEPSKKKRRHDKTNHEIVNQEERTVLKKDKKKKKAKTEKISVVEDVSAALDTEDTSIPDAQLDPISPQDEATTIEDPITNGLDSVDPEDVIEDVDHTILQSEDLSCFYEKRLSLQLPIPAVSLSHTASSLLSLHLAPLLLTYFPPAEGIVLSFSDPVLSAKPSYGVNLPLQTPKSGNIPFDPSDETFARCADAYGVCWVWLTATFLVFCPRTGDTLKGWTNVSSEGFVGLVSYNYFQTAIGKVRIPKTWTWDGPIREHNKHKKARKGKLRDENGAMNSQEDVIESRETFQAHNFGDGGSGSFVDHEGNKITASQVFRVVDVEMVPGHERDKWTLQIDGSLLSQEDEAAAVVEERQRFENLQLRSGSRSKTPGIESGEMPLMSGALPFSIEGSPS